MATTGAVVPPTLIRIKTSAIQTPDARGENHATILRQAKESIEVAQRLRGDVGDSYVRVSELVALGLAQITNGTIQLVNGAVPAAGIPTIIGGGGVGAPGATGPPGPGSRGATWVAASGAVVAPSNDVPVLVPFAGTLQEVVIMTQGGTGSCTIDIWKSPIGSYPPTVANTICGGTLPAISSGVSYRNIALTGWTTAFSQDDVLMFHLVSSSVFTEVTIQIRMG